MKKYLNMEVDNITTRRPDMLIKMRDLKFKSVLLQN
ncbi:hypothetical protein SAMN05443428_1117 [Caloramator quimbayensis]|uniref:Uncharacterized protein n=1 Tax=Caloramator quimbayensis TaxID=1147123 RepID=A0A1T4XPV5_9CLOT|nr:hypothetical protein SAMN05443428_1117 [Caloramator quimbayensis]